MYRNKKKRTIDDIGVMVIFKKDTSSIIRVAWIIAISVCIIIAVYHIADAVRHYFSYPAQLSVEMIRQVNLTLPSITFCPAEFLTHLYPDQDNLKPWPPNGTDWLEETQQFNLREYEITAEIVYADTNYPVSINDIEISTFLGLCRLLSYDQPIRYKGATTFSIFLKKREPFGSFSSPSSFATFTPSLGNSYENSLLYMLEDTKVYPLSHIFMYSRGPLKKGKKHTFQLTASEFKSKSFPNKPCEKDNLIYTRCLDTFVNKEIKKIAKCKLPFILDKNLTLTLCTDYNNLMQEYKNLTKIFDSMWDPKNTNCLENCDDVQYHLIHTLDVNLTEDEDVEFHLDLSENIKEVVTKDFGYTIPQMLSDIGGSLGLFLGCSIVTFLEILQMIGLRLKCGKSNQSADVQYSKRIQPLKSNIYPGPNFHRIQMIRGKQFWGRQSF